MTEASEPKPESRAKRMSFVQEAMKQDLDKE